MTPQITNPNAELIQGLREMADFLEAHPELKRGNPSPLNIYAWGSEAKDELAHFAKIAGDVKKNSTELSFWLRKSFPGDVQLDVNASREDVCERVQVGTKVEPEHVVPAKEVPVYEWRCGSILAPAAEEAQLEGAA